MHFSYSVLQKKATIKVKNFFKSLTIFEFPMRNSPKSFMLLAFLNWRRAEKSVVLVLLFLNSSSCQFVKISLIIGFLHALIFGTHLKKKLRSFTYSYLILSQRINKGSLIAWVNSRILNHSKEDFLDFLFWLFSNFWMVQFTQLYVFF